jgi:hypothetical protein
MLGESCGPWTLRIALAQDPLSSFFGLLIKIPPLTAILIKFIKLGDLALRLRNITAGTPSVASSGSHT